MKDEKHSDAERRDDAGAGFPFLAADGLKEGADTKIYRYMPADRFLEMVEHGINALTHLSLWEDPFEAFLIRSNIIVNNEPMRLYDFYKGVYGQSWTLKGEESDVFWRAYGRRGDAVRVETTVGKLCQSLADVAKGCGRDLVRVGKVTYRRDEEIKAMMSAKDVVRLLSSDGGAGLARTFFTKREAFRDEEEVRIIACPDSSALDRERDKNGSLLKYCINPSELIESVLLDPCMERRKAEEVTCRVLLRHEDIVVKRSSLFDWPSRPTDGTPSIAMPLARDFWRKFQEKYRNGRSEFTGKKIPDRNYWGIQVGKGILHYAVFNRDCARVELYIDTPDRERNKAIFDGIRDKNPFVASRFGALRWERLDERKGCRVSLVNESLSFKRQSDWAPAVDWLCCALDELRMSMGKVHYGDAP